MGGNAVDFKQLMAWVGEPQTHREIVGDYGGSYSLGVKEDPPAFVLRVEPEDVAKFPERVKIHGVDVPVIVHGGFAQPKPLTGRG
jgi:hypothetical protein